MIRPHWTFALAGLGIVAAGCGRRPAAVAAGADSTRRPAVADTGSPPADTGSITVKGFQNPESAKYDAELDVWYVSNVNGAPGAKDGNGYISRLKGDGTIDSLKFIVGVLLSAFGTFWVGEGMHMAWPAADWSILALIAVYLAVALSLVPLCRNQSQGLPLNSRRSE